MPRSQNRVQVGTLAMACGLLAAMPGGRWLLVEQVAAEVVGARTAYAVWADTRASCQATFTQFVVQALQVVALLLSSAIFVLRCAPQLAL